MDVRSGLTLAPAVLATETEITVAFDAYTHTNTRVKVVFSVGEGNDVKMVDGTEAKKSIERELDLTPGVRPVSFKIVFKRVEPKKKQLGVWVDAVVNEKNSGSLFFRSALLSLG